jgi:molecular chaperone DnaJ
VRAAGEGGAGTGGAASGDLYLRVRLRPHPVFERRDQDLTVKVPIGLTTAVLGGEVQVPTLTGSVRLRIPELTQPGQTFRVRGQGMPAIGKPDQRGDVYVQVQVQLPRRLTPEQRKLFEQLARIAEDKQVVNG